MIIEEPLVIRRALAAGLPLAEVWACPDQQAPATAVLYGEIAAAGIPAVEVPPQVMDKIAYREHSEGLLVLAPRQEPTLADLRLATNRPALLVVLENVEKPGNLGAVLRLCDGAGAQAVLCSGEGADPGNPNCLRASRGAAFTVPAIEAPLPEIAAWLRDHGVTILAATPDQGTPWDEVDLTGPGGPGPGRRARGALAGRTGCGRRARGHPHGRVGRQPERGHHRRGAALRGGAPAPPGRKDPLMTNAFYNDFDREELEPRDPDYRSVFQRGRDRLIHNAAFRRLQAKTQVFLSGEYDFYRTRLTHSIEVAQIAGSIARWLNSSSPLLKPGFESTSPWSNPPPWPTTSATRPSATPARAPCTG